MFRLPGVVDHRPAPCLGKPHGAALVRHATSVIRLVVPRDLVAVVRRAVVSEELVGRQGASLVQQLNTTRNDAIRFLCAARYLIVALNDARRKRLEIVFVIVLETQSIKTQCSSVTFVCGNCLLHDVLRCLSRKEITVNFIHQKNSKATLNNDKQHTHTHAEKRSHSIIGLRDNSSGPHYCDWQTLHN